MTVFHFAAATLRDGAPLPAAGDELSERPAVLCESGWHGSERAVDALTYAPGPYVALRELHGEVVSLGGKACASHARMLTGYVNASAVLREFAQWCDARASACAAERAAAALASAAEAGEAPVGTTADAAEAQWAFDAAEAARTVAERAVSARRAAASAQWAADSAYWATEAARASQEAAYWAAIAAAERPASWNASWASGDAALNAECDAQEEWLRPRLLALLGQEAEG